MQQREHAHPDDDHETHHHGKHGGDAVERGREQGSRHPGEAVPRALATKSSVWAYEEEWRSLQPDRAGQVVKFNPEVITGVVLGAKCRTEDEAWIRDRIRPLGLPVERMRPDRSSFKLLREAA